MPDNNKRMGKYVSMLLRHHPEEAGVILDEHGWTDVKDLIENKYLCRELDEYAAEAHSMECTKA